MRARLSDAFIQAIEADGEEYVVWDADLVGFGLRIGASGSKSYLYEIADGQRMTIGRHGDPWTCDGAREEARRLMNESIRTDERSQTLAFEYGVRTEVIAPAVSAQDSLAEGRYVLERVLGEGAFKQVYLARDTTLNRRVAIALIRSSALDERGRQRVEREMQALAALAEHPHIVTLYDVGVHNDRLYMVSEYMAGGELEKVAARFPEGRLPLKGVLLVGVHVSRALEGVHKAGIVHRDIKPGNMWLTADRVTKIGDFGLALWADRTRLTTRPIVMGTVAYMAPEQIRGEVATPQTDLYALGCTLYHLATGQRPFEAPSAAECVQLHLNRSPRPPSELNPDLPPELDQVIVRLLSKRPAERFDSATAVGKALTKIRA